MFLSEAFRIQTRLCLSDLIPLVKALSLVKSNATAAVVHPLIENIVDVPSIAGPKIKMLDYHTMVPTYSESDWSSKLRGVAFYSATGFVAIFLFVVMLASHPFVLLFDRYKRKAHHVIGKIWASLTIYPFFNVKFEGLENLPPSDNPAVYVSNHQSFLDIYTLLTLGRTFKFISKTGVFVIPIVGWAMFLMGLIPLRRMDSSSQLECLKRCMDLVRKGASVFFFPEGTRSRDGKLGAFKKGAFSVAAKTRVPVVPITLMGTGNLMPAGREDLLNTGSVRVVIHKPIEGSNPEILCNVARTAIADVLLRHGYGVH
ncbi:1-acyl-sn-glycerol-3-phosphate acyltransferase lpat1, chloroplastic [Asimina triloba]